MLVRAGHRKPARLDAKLITSAVDAPYGILFPFLCPALVRRRSATAVPTKRVRRPGSPLPHPPRLDRPRTRNLASIATPSGIQTDSYTGHPPLTSDTKTQSHWNWSFPLGRTSTSDPPAPYNPLFLTHASQPAPLGPSRHGIGGTSTELLQNIYTCLRVHRWDRAEACISRLVEQSDSTPGEIAHAHRAYFQARLEAMIPGSEGLANYRAMQRWWRAHVRYRDHLPVGDLPKLALVKAALQVDTSEKWKIELRRLFRELDLTEETLLTHQALTSDEFLYVCKVFAGRHLEAYDFLLDKYATPPADDQEELAYAAPINEPPSIVTSDDLPEVLRIEQKGFGLEALKQGLDAIGESRSTETNAHSSHARNTEREVLIEASASAAAVARWKAEDEKLQAIGIMSNLHSRPMGALMWTWYSALLPVIKDEIAQTRTALDAPPSLRTDKRTVYGAHLESISPEVLTSNTILYVMNMLGRGKDRESDTYSSDLKLAVIATGLGKAMQNESNAEAARRTSLASNHKPAAKSARHKSKSRSSTKSLSATPLSSLEWPAAIRVRIGALLLSKLIETATIPVTREHPRTKEPVTQLQPAFFHKTIYKKGKKQGYLLASQDLIEKFHREPLGDLICKKLPMVVEPLPWTAFRSGGYLNYSTDFIRYPATDRSPRDYAVAAIERGDMQTVFDAINILSRIPWVINNKILRIQIEAWNKGETLGSFAPLDPSASYPPEPTESADPNVRKRWLAHIKEIKDRNSSLHSLRCHQNLQLETARAFRNETIYLPHNIDFRGRAYPIPPYLNHMGADNSRALMQFATGKPLGVNGLRWLKIHLANVAGNDKASLQEREDWVMENIAQVYDSAERPLEGGRWWAKSDDAWQTLAACIELRNALKSADPTTFVSHLPIHQDGTCNGLQHYAALGGDEIGARQVNLEPGDRPSDVYTAVAEAVKAHIAKDLEKGDPRAKILDGRVGRRIVKQPVMTNVYGVTYYGVRAQVKKQLEDILPDILKTDELNHAKLAGYIADKISQSLNEMFNGAQAIQEWFGKCADRITSSITAEQIGVIRHGTPQPEKGRKAGIPHSAIAAVRRNFNSSVIWTTPLRLPVVQPYRSSTRLLVSTAIQNVTLQHPQTWDPINKRKQLQAFPPNFVHSLDASHMMLSAIKCNEKGITFASIHDSFWTHACSIDDMSDVLRNAFIDMHGENIVGRLREEFTARYKDNMYLASVNVDTPVGKRIRKQQESTYEQRRKITKKGTKNTLLTELIIEVDRLKLLKSDDPAERQKGQVMVTPGSLFEDDPDESSLVLPHEITSTMLGTGADPAGTGAVADVDVDDDVDTGIDANESELSDEVEVGLEAGIEDSATVKAQLKSNAAKATKASRAARSSKLGKAGKATKDVSAVKNADATSCGKKVYVWLPMSFPEIPRKGTFDVTRLKESRYFFH